MKQNKKTKELITLISENTDLPIKFMVNSDIITEEGYSYYLADLESFNIEEYTEYEETIHFRSDIGDLIDAYYNQNADEIHSKLGVNDVNDSKIDEFIISQFEDKWTKAILIWVGL